MARPRQPIQVVQGKKKKHLTRKEIEERTASEVSAPSDQITPPTFLSVKQKKEFQTYANTLIKIGIFTNLDCVALGQYLVAKDEWVLYTKLVDRLSHPTVPGCVKGKKERENAVMTDLLANMGDLEKVTSLQDKAFKRCRACASDLGLTISSRCRLVLPKDKEPEDSNAGLFGDPA